MNNDPFQKLESFFFKHRVFRYKKRETFLISEETPLGVFYITEGYVRSYLLSKNGRELTVAIYKPGDIFPTHWLINNEFKSHYYETLSKLTAYRVQKDNFLRFLKQNDDVYFYEAQRILVKQNSTSNRMEVAILGSAGEKVSGILAFLANDMGEKKGNEIKFKVAFTHKDIASLLGLTRETVSLELEKLERKSLIIQKNRSIIIQDFKKLMKETNKE